METKKKDIGDGKIIEITYFDNPMTHDDWHKAEGMGLIYSHYNHEGPDYWDDSLVFCKVEDEESYEKFIKENTW